MLLFLKFKKSGCVGYILYKKNIFFTFFDFIDPSGSIKKVLSAKKKVILPPLGSMTGKFYRIIIGLGAFYRDKMTKYQG